MKTILTKKIENHDIIIGFDNAVIEPIETNKKVKFLFEDSNELKVFNKKIKEIEVRSKNINETMKIIKGLDFKLNNPKSSEVDKVQAKEVMESNKEKLKNEYDKKLVLQNDLKILHENCEKKRKELFIQNCIYFETREGEEIISDSYYLELKSKFESKLDNYLLDIDGNEIANFKNFEYYIFDETWSKVKIEELGIEISVDGILYSNLTDDQKTEIFDQFENERIISLGTVEKEIEKNNAIDSVMEQTINMRSKLEIQGDTDALTKSQDWYNAEVDKINIKYA